MLELPTAPQKVGHRLHSVRQVVAKDAAVDAAIDMKMHRHDRR